MSKTRPTVARIIFIMALLIFASTECLSADDYVVGEGDLLKITVYENPDLTTEARVGGDGKISFPLIGEVKVTGKTSAEIERHMAALLEDGYIKKPHVTVFIEEYKSRKVTVLGEFVKPGLVELRGSATLMEVKSSAGGITPNAGETLFIQRQIFRGGTSEKEDITITIDLKRLLEEGDVTANAPVQDGDSIYVPRASFVYVTGEVKTQGAYKITKGLTVLKAITLAGGFSDKAWKGNTKIIRKNKEGDEITTKVAMDAMILPDDVIMVPLSFF